MAIDINVINIAAPTLKPNSCTFSGTGLPVKASKEVIH